MKLHLLSRRVSQIDRRPLLLRRRPCLELLLLRRVRDHAVLRERQPQVHRAEQLVHQVVPVVPRVHRVVEVVELRLRPAPQPDAGQQLAVEAVPRVRLVGLLQPPRQVHRPQQRVQAHREAVADHRQVVAEQLLDGVGVLGGDGDGADVLVVLLVHALVEEGDLVEEAVEQVEGELVEEQRGGHVQHRHREGRERGVAVGGQGEQEEEEVGGERLDEQLRDEGVAEGGLEELRGGEHARVRGSLKEESQRRLSQRRKKPLQRR